MLLHEKYTLGKHSVFAQAEARRQRETARRPVRLKQSEQQGEEWDALRPDPMHREVVGSLVSSQEHGGRDRDYELGPHPVLQRSLQR